MATPNLSPGKQKVLTFVSPNVEDLIFYESRDVSLPLYKSPPPYGTEHPDILKYPNHVLVFVSPDSEKTPTWSRWYYAAKRESQDDYNFEIDGVSRLTRTYVIPRAEYIGGTEFPEPAKGLADTVFTSFNYAQQTIRRIGQKELDSHFVVIQRIFVDEGQVSAVSRSGGSRGESTSEKSILSTPTAVHSPTGIVVSRSSNLTKDEMWNNSEDKILVREGDNSETVSHGPGIKTVRTTELSLTEPVEEADDKTFKKDLVTTDADGVDALWSANREKLVNEPSVGSETVTQLGGGIAGVAHSLVPEATAPDEGLLILSSQVAAIGGGDARKVTKTIDAYPTLVEEVYDDTTKGMIEITKDVIVPGSANGSYVAGDITEIKPVDKWRSLQIRSRYMVSPEGNVETFPYVSTYQYPPVLNAANYLYLMAYAWSNNAAFAYSESIALEYDLTESYSTTVEGRVLRITTSDPATTIAAYAAATTTGLFSTTLKYDMYYLAYGNPNSANTTIKTWQTPMAVVPTQINIGIPPSLAGNVTYGTRYYSTIIPAGGTLPSGWTTMDISTTKGKLGMYVVSVKQLNL